MAQCVSLVTPAVRHARMAQQVDVLHVQPQMHFKAYFQANVSRHALVINLKTEQYVGVVTPLVRVVQIALLVDVLHASCLMLFKAQLQASASQHALKTNERMVLCVRSALQHVLAAKIAQVQSV